MIHRAERPTGPSPYARRAIEAQRAPITRVPQPRTGRGPPAIPMDRNFLPHRRSRPMVRGRRRKVKGDKVETRSHGSLSMDNDLQTVRALKITGAFLNVTFSDIGSASHRSGADASQTGGTVADGESSGRPKPKGNPSSQGRSRPWEGSSSAGGPAH